MMRACCLRIMALMCLLIPTRPEQGEPVCYSRFDYDEKMLMKLLRIEDKIETFERENERQVQLMSDMGNQLIRLADKVNLSDTTIAFTASAPKDGPTSGTIGFTNVVTNEGDAFDPDTGVFTCKVPGMYYFSMSLVKLRAFDRVDKAHCYLNKNGNTMLKAYIDPSDKYADIGSYGVSNVAFIRILKGDLVRLTGCSAIGSLDSQSSFSGLLVKHSSI